MVTSARAAGIAASGLQGVSTNNSTPSMASPSQVSNAVGSGLGYTPNAVSTNPHDAPGYNPATDPTSSAYNPAAVNTNQTTPKTTSTTTPPAATADATTNSTQSTQSTPSGLPGVAPLTGDTASQAGQAIDQLKQKYGKALTDITGTGVQSPTGQGSANAGIQKALDSQPKPQQETPTPAAVSSFMDPSQNPLLDQQTQTLREFLSPAADRQALTDSLDQLKSDRSSLMGLKTELMNVKNIMAGSQQDIEDEVTKAGGTISASLLSNMTIARNRALVQRGQQLTDQIQAATDLVNTDTTLVGDMKQMAQEQFTNNMSLLKYQQDNYQNQQNAAKDTIKMLLGPNMENAQAVYNSVKGTPYESRYEQILGLPAGGMAQLAAIPNTTAEKDALQIQGLKLDNAKKANDLKDSTGSGAQDKLEQEYRQILVKEVSSRSGTVGTEDAKVAQANHLAALANQYYDPNTGNYNIPTAQYGELVLGLAGMLSKTGTPTDSQLDTINQKTAAGDLKGAVSYVTGTPQTGSTQAIIKNLVDSVDRQAQVAESNREAGLNVLRGLAPTGLEQTRKDALEANTLVKYSGIKKGIQNTSANILKAGDTGTLSSGITWTIK